MKRYITESDFIDTFQRSDTYKGNFTYEGLTALYEYLEQYEQEIGEEIEFDMVALCCEYSEYDSAWEAMEQYQPEDMPTVDEPTSYETRNGGGMDLVELGEAQEKLALEWLEERTQVIPVGDTGRVIIQQF